MFTVKLLGAMLIGVADPPDETVTVCVCAPSVLMVWLWLATVVVVKV